MPADLLQIVERFAGRKVLLIGDFMLDRYIFGDAERISPEAPVPVLRVVERQDRVGGAGSVALNIAALGANVVCCGVLGHDPFGERVEQALRDAGCDVSGLIRVDDRPTITKTRLIGLAEHRHRQQIIRVDDELVRSLREADARRLTDVVGEQIGGVDVVCLEDYAKGVLTRKVCASITAMAREAGRLVFVDPARRPWEDYENTNILTPNRRELEIAAGGSVSDEALIATGVGLAERWNNDALVITLGRDGALLVRRDGSSERFPTTPRAVYDNTGAGDAVLAMMAVASAAGASLGDAVRLANIAGGLEVSKFGCVPITRGEVMEELQRGPLGRRGKLRSCEELIGEINARRQRGETVVFTNGCFDILHPGHVELLEQAKALGSILVVGINSDSSVRALNKGEDRPIRCEKDRARLLAALEAVDYITVFEESTPLAVIERLLPDVLVKGSDWAGKGVVGQEVVEARGGRVALVELVQGYSTTGELERIRAATQHVSESAR